MLAKQTRTSIAQDVASDKGKILVLDQSGVLGGAELSLLEICKRIRHGAQVVLFDDGPFREKLEAAGVAVKVSSHPHFAEMHKQGGRTFSPANVLATMKLVARIFKLARSHKIIYANTQKAMIIGAAVGFITRRPVVWHLRDIVSAEHFDKEKLRLIKWFSKYFLTHVIANSEASALALKELAGLPADRISVVYNGIDVKPFDATRKSSVNDLRSRHGLPHDAFLVGIFSRLAQWKGQHVLLDAIAKIPDAHAVLVGAALFGENAYETALKAQAEKLGISHRVHFLGFQSDIAGLMSAVDIVAHTSIAPEPFGRVIVEAMLAQTPIIASAAGGALEILTNDVDGLLTEPGNAHALAESVQMLRDNPVNTRRLVRHAYASARARFDPDMYCRAVIRRLEQVGGFSLPSERMATAAETEQARSAQRMLRGQLFAKGDSRN